MGIMISKVLFQLTNPQILVMLYIFYRSAPKLISISKGYGEIIQDSPVDLTPEIKLWQKRKRVIKKYSKKINISDKIELKNVFFSYNQNKILYDINFNLKKGDLLLLMGESGSGKSTLLDIICGFLKPTKGIVNVLGNDPSKQRYEDFLVPHVSILRPETNIIQGTLISNIAFLIQNPDLEKVKDLIYKVGLGNLLKEKGVYKKIDSKGSNLSAGQRQRILIARALYKNPKLLILDEPTSNLDLNTEKEINKLLLSILNSIIMIVVSHNKLLKKKATFVYELRNSKLKKLNK